jgi:hypothetical protein
MAVEGATRIALPLRITVAGIAHHQTTGVVAEFPLTCSDPILPKRLSRPFG